MNTKYGLHFQEVLTIDMKESEHVPMLINVQQITSIESTERDHGSSVFSYSDPGTLVVTMSDGRKLYVPGSEFEELHGYISNHASRREE